jgi:hypothetical protein
MRTELHSLDDNGGLARRITYSIGILYAFFLLSIAYRPTTTTDVAGPIIYSLLLGAFLAGRWIAERRP